MKRLTENTEFIIGIDFGHGETSAAFYSLKDETIADLDILPGQKVVKSAVAILQQEGKTTICVGDAAIVQAPMAKDFQVAFKKRPSEMSEEERLRMVAFMKGVYEGIIDRHPDYRHREHRVFIARPSQDSLWKKEEEAYIKIAEDAGIPVAGIQKESRAAYFRARTQPDSKIDKQLSKGVLIVDFGSSTIDFTYLNKNLQTPIDDGADLGASAVEAYLLQNAMDNPQDPVMATFKQKFGCNVNSNAYNQLLYKFRVAKEEFYGKKLPHFSVSIDYSIITSAESEQLLGFGGINLSKEKVREILESKKYNCYIQSIETAVRKFKDEKLKSNNVACVYLTGGASRMDFVREVFMKVFNLTAEQCPCDDNPSLIVSQGVAHLSYADYKTQDNKVKLQEQAENIINAFDWDGKIKEIIYASIKQTIIEKVKSIMCDYKDGCIYDYHTVKDGIENGTYYGFGIEIGNSANRKRDGFLKYRNLESLIKRFKVVFDNFVEYDFATATEEIVKTQILTSVNTKLRETLSAYCYDSSKESALRVSGLSARLSKSGVDTLTNKFTEEGDGHVLYDAVKSCYIGGWMVGWDKQKDRWDLDRQQHYRYYNAHYPSIFSDFYWNDFLKNNIQISGIDSVKEQVTGFVMRMLDEYLSYAKLAIFFN